MEGIALLLDTNVFSDLLRSTRGIQKQLEAARSAGARLILCQPVYYEVIRGLEVVKATRKRQVFDNEIMELFERVALDDADWHLAAQLWAKATSAGRQLSDTDFLIASLCSRHGFTLVTADDDFAIFDFPRLNWREP